jgi:hypothetical protein
VSSSYSAVECISAFQLFGCLRHKCLSKTKFDFTASMDPTLQTNLVGCPDAVVTAVCICADMYMHIAFESPPHSSLRAGFAVD